MIARLVAGGSRRKVVYEAILASSILTGIVFGAMVFAP
jgi:hypothetical protein